MKKTRFFTGQDNELFNIRIGRRLQYRNCVCNIRFNPPEQCFFWQNLNVDEIFGQNFGQNLNVGTDGSTRHFLTSLTKLYFLAIECTNKSLLCDKKTHSMYIK